MVWSEKKLELFVIIYLFRLYLKDKIFLLQHDSFFVWVLSYFFYQTITALISIAGEYTRHHSEMRSIIHLLLIYKSQSESWQLSYWRKFSDFSETIVNRPSLRVPPMLSPLKLILIFLPRSLLAEKLDVCCSTWMYSEKFLILISILAQVTSQFSIILFSCLTKKQKKVIMNYYHVNPTTESDSCSDEESCRGSNLPHSSTLINPTRKRRRGIIGKFLLSM